MKGILALFSASLLLGATGLVFACESTVKSIGGQKSSGSNHNVDLYEYSSSVDAWVLMDSWHDPAAQLRSSTSADYLYSEPGWPTSVLFINADPSAPPPNPGGGGTPPGGGIDDPQSMGNEERKPTNNSKTCEEPAELDDMTIVGISGGLRNWLGGAASAWRL